MPTKQHVQYGKATGDIGYQRGTPTVGPKPKAKKIKPKAKKLVPVKPARRTVPVPRPKAKMPTPLQKAPLSRMTSGPYKPDLPPPTGVSGVLPTPIKKTRVSTRTP